MDPININCKKNFTEINNRSDYFARNKYIIKL